MGQASAIRHQTISNLAHADSIYVTNQYMIVCVCVCVCVCVWGGGGGGGIVHARVRLRSIRNNKHISVSGISISMMRCSRADIYKLMASVAMQFNDKSNDNWRGYILIGKAGYRKGLRIVAIYDMAVCMVLLGRGAGGR